MNNLATLTSIVLLAQSALASDLFELSAAKSVSVSPETIAFCKSSRFRDAGISVVIEQDSTDQTLFARVSSIRFGGNNPILDSEVKMEVIPPTGNKGCTYIITSVEKESSNKILLTIEENGPDTIEIEVKDHPIPEFYKTIVCTVTPAFNKVVLGECAKK